MTVRRIMPYHESSDLEATRAFYTQVLGLEEGNFGGGYIGFGSGPAQVLFAPPGTAPVTLAVTVFVLPGGGVGTDAWLGFAYVSLFSMFLGFFAWYAGLALGGVAKAGQVQLLQTPFTLGLAALVLGETITTAAVLSTIAVLASVAGTQRARVHRIPPQ